MLPHRKASRASERKDVHNKHKLHTKQELYLGPSADRTHHRKPSTSSWSKGFKSTLTGWRLCEHGQRLTPHCLHGERVLARRRHGLAFYSPIHRELLVQSERHLQRAQMQFHTQKKTQQQQFIRNQHNFIILIHINKTVLRRHACNEFYLLPYLPLLFLGFLSFNIKRTKWELNKVFHKQPLRTQYSRFVQLGCRLLNYQKLTSLNPELDQSLSSHWYPLLYVRLNSVFYCCCFHILADSESPDFASASRLFPLLREIFGHLQRGGV